MEQYALSIKRVIIAPVEKVFNAWTKPELVKQWFGSESVTTPKADIIPEKQGAYNITMLTNQGKEIIVVGAIEEIVPNEKLVFTWKYKLEDSAPTLVTINFKDLGDNKTELILTHEKFTTEKSKLAHENGWTSIINNLEKFLLV